MWSGASLALLSLWTICPHVTLFSAYLACSFEWNGARVSTCSFLVVILKAILTNSWVIAFFLGVAKFLAVAAASGIWSVCFEHGADSLEE